MRACTGLLLLGLMACREEVAAAPVAAAALTPVSAAQPAVDAEGACDAEVAAPAAVVVQPDAPMSFTSRPAVGTKATCPVMNQVFTVVEGTPHAEHDGKHFVFCCEGCKARFDENPRAYP